MVSKISFILILNTFFHNCINDWYILHIGMQVELGLGIIYGFGYILEEHGPAFAEFMEMIGEKVFLKGFEGYRAQLDIKSKDFIFFLWNLIAR